MVRKIIKFPAPSLRVPCKAVSFPLTPELSEHISDLKDTLATTPHGVALASNQILAEGHRVFVVRPGLNLPKVKSMSGEDSLPEVVINPKWEVYPPHEIDTQHPYDWPEHAGFVEGCLSIPELSMPHVRQYWVEMEYQDEEGRTHVTIARQLAARIIQHECDHLDGILYPMRIRDFRRFGFTDVLFPELI